MIIIITNIIFGFFCLIAVYSIMKDIKENHRISDGIGIVIFKLFLSLVLLVFYIAFFLVTTGFIKDNSYKNMSLLSQEFPPTKTTLKINDKYNEDFKVKQGSVNNPYNSYNVLILKQNQVEFTIPFSRTLFSQLTLSYGSDYNKTSIPNDENSNKINPVNIKANSKATMNISNCKIKFIVVKNDIKHHDLVLQQTNTGILMESEQPIILKIKYDNKNGNNWISQLNFK